MEEKHADVGSLLAKQRQQLHLSQGELSIRSGVRQCNISRIERGDAVPNVLTLEKLAHGMGKKLLIQFI